MVSTFERIENEVALTFGFNDFDQLYQCGTKDDVYEAMKEVALRYSNYIAVQACIKQRQICYAHATVSHKITLGGNHKFYEVDKESILQAPLATEK